MRTISINENILEVGKSIYLISIDDCSRDVANYFAEIEGTALIRQQREVVKFLRGYYKQSQNALISNILVRTIELKFGPE
jgi:sulfur relay (sulfurtransferase) DsrC/TusE family protein